RGTQVMRRSSNMIARTITCAVAVLSLLIGSGCASSSPEQKRFKSPQAAVDTLVVALRANDTAKLKQIFGPGGDEIVSSGDPVADQNQAKKFLAAYDQRHRLEDKPEGTTLLIGDGDWPFPVPIVKA